LRGMAAIILQNHGYRVLEATSGPDAIQVWQQHQGKIHLLLTDMVMPGGITGHELAEKLKAFNPTLKAVYTSGYSAEMSGLASGLRDKAPFLQKPYHPQKLASTIRACLDSK
jgi:two-component system cell cycle sensor histidine kinase/response regulator CckA